MIMTCRHALRCYTDNMHNAIKLQILIVAVFYISIQHDEKPYCTNCYMRDFGPRGESK